jgi:aspartate/glutamate racemase
MSKEDRDNEFWEITDEFIKLANEKCDKHKNGKVSSSILFSAARFNAFMYASTAKNLQDFSKDKELAIEYLSAQYKKILIENLSDYEKNYKDYLQK